jgi:hypothetical protein
MAKKNNDRFGNLDFWRNELCTNPYSRKDWNLWAEYIEGGGSLFDELRVFIAQVLRGDEKRPAHRPKNTDAKKYRDVMMLAVYMLEADAMKPDEAVKQTAKHFAVNERTVRRVMVRLLPRTIQQSIDTTRKEIFAKKLSIDERASNLLSRLERLQKTSRERDPAHKKDIEARLFTLRSSLEASIRDAASEFDALHKEACSLSTDEMDADLRRIVTAAACDQDRKG